MRILLSIFFLFSFFNCKERSEFVFAGGFSDGTYYKVADSLSVVSHFSPKVLATEGSIDNIFKLVDGKADYGITQLDVFQNSSLGNPDVFDKIKILLPLYGEELHLLALRKYENLEQLKGKKISIGDPESGSKLTSLIFLGQLGINGDNSTLEEFNYTVSLEMLLKGEIDAMVMVAGAPVKLLSELPENTKDKIRLLSIPQEGLKSVQGTGLIYQKSEIPSGTYSWEVSPIETLLVQSVIIGNTKASKKTVKNFLNGIWENRNVLITKHEKWKNLKLEYVKRHLERNANFFHPDVPEIIGDWKE